MKKKHKKKKGKYNDLNINHVSKEWKKIFNNWDGKTHKKYKGLPELFIDELSGKIVINKKTKSLRPYDVFLLENDPEHYCCKKTETREEKILKREKILEKQSARMEEMEAKQDRDFWKAVDYAIKHPNKSKTKMTKSEKKIMEFFNKRNGLNKKSKDNKKKIREKYNKLGAIEFLNMVEIDQLNVFIENSKNEYIYGYKKNGKKRNPHKALMDRQMERYDSIPTGQSKRAVDIFKETLVEEIEARLMYDPFSVNGNPVVDYSKYNANINKDLSEKDKKKKKKNNKINMGRLTI